MKNSLQVFTSFFFSLLIIFAGIFVLFNLAMGECKKLGEARIQLAERQATTQKLNELILKFREQVVLFDDLNEQVASVGNALPSSLKIPEILVSLESIAQQNSVLIRRVAFTVIEPSTMSNANESGFTNFSATQSRKESEPYPVSVSLDVSGNYLGAKSFLQGVEEELRLMDVKTFELVPSGGEASQNQDDSASSFNMKLTLDAYSIKKPQFTLP